MTKYVETKMVEQTSVKFIANDGKEFVGDNAERECAAYERTQHEDKVINEFKKLRPKWINVPLLDWFSGESEVIAVTVNDEIDFDITVRDYYYIKSPEFMDMTAFYTKRPKEFPCNIVLVNGYEWVDIIGDDDLKNQLQTALKQLS